ncbi:hypothetical protein ACFYOG_35810 [Streptomyces sp. NPDC007818]|uniref:hypothetical protein n=1 Tax=Streptomyces sp. NPDC007818 TaxID=3364780 RepID=UPI0036C2DE57
MASVATKAFTVGALAVAAVATVAPSANASGISASTLGCKGYWYSTSFHGYCNSVTKAGQFQLFAACDYQSDYYGKWRQLPVGYVGKFDYDECTFSVETSYIRYAG